MEGVSLQEGATRNGSVLIRGVALWWDFPYKRRTTNVFILFCICKVILLFGLASPHFVPVSIQDMEFERHMSWYLASMTLGRK